MTGANFCPVCYEETIAERAAHAIMRVAGFLVMIAICLYVLSNVYRMGQADGAFLLRGSGHE